MLAYLPTPPTPYAWRQRATVIFFVFRCQQWRTPLCQYLAAFSALLASLYPPGYADIMSTLSIARLHPAALPYWFSITSCRRISHSALADSYSTAPLLAYRRSRGHTPLALTSTAASAVFRVPFKRLAAQQRLNADVRRATTYTSGDTLACLFRIHATLYFSRR